MTLTPEQQEFRAVVRQFAEDKLAPLAAETDRTAEYSWPAFEALRSMELTGLSYPEEYGGAGADLVTQAIVAEELARVDASASLMFLISKLAMLPVLNFASDELKAPLPAPHRRPARARAATACPRPTPGRTSPR